MQRRTPKISKFGEKVKSIDIASVSPVICTSCAQPLNLDHGFSWKQDKYICLPCYFK